MGLAFMMAPCISCSRIISFNPHKVPSIKINNEGPREPLCRACAEKWNELHPEAAKPIQSDAYEAIPEEEL